MKKIIVISLFLPVLAVTNKEESCCFQGMMDFGNFGDHWFSSLLFFFASLFLIIEIVKVLSDRRENKSAADIFIERHNRLSVDLQKQTYIDNKEL